MQQRTSLETSKQVQQQAEVCQRGRCCRPYTFRTVFTRWQSLNCRHATCLNCRGSRSLPSVRSTSCCSRQTPPAPASCSGGGQRRRRLPYLRKPVPGRLPRGERRRTATAGHVDAEADQQRRTRAPRGRVAARGTSRSSQWWAKKCLEMEEQCMVRPERRYICSHCHEDSNSTSHGKYDGARYCSEDPSLEGITLEEWKAKKKK